MRASPATCSEGSRRVIYRDCGRRQNICCHGAGGLPQPFAKTASRMWRAREEFFATKASTGGRSDCSLWWQTILSSAPRRATISDADNAEKRIRNRFAFPTQKTSLAEEGLMTTRLKCCAPTSFAAAWHTHAATLLAGDALGGRARQTGHAATDARSAVYLGVDSLNIRQSRRCLDRFEVQRHDINDLLKSMVLEIKRSRISTSLRLAHPISKT